MKRNSMRGKMACSKGRPRRGGTLCMCVCMCMCHCKFTDLSHTYHLNFATSSFQRIGLHLTNGNDIMRYFILFLMYHCRSMWRCSDFFSVSLSSHREHDFCPCFEFNHILLWRCFARCVARQPMTKYLHTHTHMSPDDIFA